MSQRREESNTRPNRGLELTRAIHYNNAIEKLDEELKITSEDYDRTVIFYKKGIAHFLLGEYFEALGCFEKASKLSAKSNKPNPIVPYIWYNKGITLGKLERFAEAIECFTKADVKPESKVEHSSKDLDQVDCLDIKFWLFYNKGIALILLKRYEEAIKCFDRALDKNRKFDLAPYVALALYNKGYAYGMLKQYEKASICFDKAIEKDEDNSDALRNRSFVLYKIEERKNEKERNYDQVRKCFDDAVKADPKFPYTLNTKGYVLNCLGAEEKNKETAKKHFEDAIDILKQATDIDSKFAPAWYNMGYAYYSLQEVEKALGCFDKAISSDPKNAYAWNYKGLVLFDLRKYGNAIRCFDSAIEIDEDNLYAWYGKALTHMKIKEYYEAYGYFDRLTRICAKCKKDVSALDYEVLAWNYKGLCLTSMTNDEYNRPVKGGNNTYKDRSREGRLKEAKDCFDKAIEIFPKEKKVGIEIAEVWRNEGYVLGNEKNYNKAIDCFKEAIEILKGIKESGAEKQHSLSETFRNMGFAYYKLGSEKKEESEKLSDFDKAREYFKEAVDCEKSAFALNSEGYNIIRTLKDPEELGKAVSNFEDATSKKPDFAYAYYNKGIALSSQGLQEKDKDKRNKKFEAAKIAFDKAIDLKPHSSYAWNGKGYALNFLEQYAEAIECFNKAMEFQEVSKRDPDIETIEEEPSFNFAWLGKGYALNFLERYKEAIEYFDNVIREITKSIEEDPRCADRFNNKGIALCADRFNNKGIALYNKGIALFNLESFHDARKKFKEAIICFEEAANIEPKKKNQEQQACNEARAHLSRAQCSYALDEFFEAKEEFRQIDDKYLDSGLQSEKYNNIGLCYYRLEDFKEAKESFEKAIELNEKLNEKSITVYYNRAVLYNREKNLEAAKGLFKRCLSLAENDNTNYKVAAKANDALKRLNDSSGRSDWYDWWFAAPDKHKRKLGWIVLGSILGSFLLLVGMRSIKDFLEGSSGGLSWLVLLIVLFTGVLLLPSLRKFAVSGVELSTEIFSAKSEIKPEMDLVKSKMPFSDPMQSFRMPLLDQELSLIKDFQIQSVVMPVQYAPTHAMLYRIGGLVNGQDLF